MTQIPNTHITCFEDDNEVLDLIKTLPHKGKYTLEILDMEGDAAHLFPIGITLTLLLKFAKEGDSGLMCFQCPWEYKKELRTLVITLSKMPGVIFHAHPKIYKHVMDQLESMIQSDEFIIGASEEELNKFMKDMSLALEDPENVQKIKNFRDGKWTVTHVDDL